MKAIGIIGFLFLLLSTPGLSATQDEEISEKDRYFAWASEIWDSLDRQSGAITIKQAGAVLNVPLEFYYLSPADAEKVLVEVWGNLPGQTTLGMLFPADMTPFEADSWAVTIDYEEDGYVSDEDADEIDYAELLQQMQKDTVAESEARVEQGYDSIELLGWAAPPY